MFLILVSQANAAFTCVEFYGGKTVLAASNGLSLPVESRSDCERSLKVSRLGFTCVNPASNPRDTLIVSDSSKSGNTLALDMESCIASLDKAVPGSTN